jgi:protein-tyrosine phosphatase
MRSDIYWIEGPWPGRLAIMPRPRGGDWLEDEIASWKRAGIAVVVSLLEDDEAGEMNLASESTLSAAKGIEFISYPIVDRGVPESRTGTLALAGRLKEHLASGRNVAIHCRQGIGRAALIAACVLIASGVEGETSIRRLIEARGCAVPETAEQRQWILNFAKLVVAPTARLKFQVDQEPAASENPSLNPAIP